MTTPAPRPRSGLGIASLATSLLSAFLLLAALLLSTFFVIPTFAAGPHAPMSLLLGLLALFTAIAQVCAIALGIGNCLQPGRSKQYGILGLLCALLTLGAMAALMAYGMTRPG
ncbi:hypothetical protein J7373_09880 [Xanthomonas sp. A2111]|uniref:Uncharacterized protein n=1 Tax=Xanthomonas hawaiiensis TaxID=3003247 RepID=A0ABU2I282_9XANT|nr:hypothetical protein [Xanthomonas sp. A2111]MBO9828555.1 hypothetical protein [Xanthomonas sp. A2111]MDS9992252.1 hypothetical protein [Xanthomonas sp. A2111]